MQEDLSATFNASSSSVQRNPQVGVNDCQADHSYSERSIDEAILETTQRSVSPTSPAKLKRGKTFNTFWRYSCSKANI